jgi:hypothetical protein
MDPLPGVVITAREIYDSVVRLTGRVDVLIEQHASLAQDLSDHEHRADTRYADHEARLRSLERARWPLPSLAAAVSIASLAIALIPKL